MDTVGCGPVWRWPVATLSTRRYTDPKAVVGLGCTWYEGSDRSVRALTSGRSISSSVQEEKGVRRTPTELGQVGCGTPLLAGGPHLGNAAEVESNPGPGDTLRNGLESSGVIFESVLDDKQGIAVGSRSTRHLGSIQGGEPEVGPCTSASELHISERAANRLQLAESFMERLGSSRVDLRCTRLLPSYVNLLGAIGSLPRATRNGSAG